jgi:hypothetical protein
MPHTSEDKNLRIQPVSPAYFRTLSIPLLAERPFAAADRDGAPRVGDRQRDHGALLFLWHRPVGKRFSWWPTDPKNIGIVGVVKDASTTTPGRMRQVWYMCRHCGRGWVPATSRFEDERTTGAPWQPHRRLPRCDRAVIQTSGSSRSSPWPPRESDVGPRSAGELVSAGVGILATLLTSVGLHGVLPMPSSGELRSPEFARRWEPAV